MGHADPGRERRDASAGSTGSRTERSSVLRAVFSGGVILVLGAAVIGVVVGVRGGGCKGAESTATQILTHGRGTEQERADPLAALRVDGSQVRSSTSPATTTVSETGSRTIQSLSPQQLAPAQAVVGKFQGTLFGGPLTRDGWTWAALVGGGDEISQGAQAAIKEFVAAYLDNPTPQGAQELENNLNRVVAKLRELGRLE